MLPSVVEKVKTLESVGQNQYREFVTEKTRSRSKTKMSLHHSLPLLTYVQEQNDRADVDMLLLDGAVIVNMPRPRPVKKMHEYSQQVFIYF